MMNMDQMFTSVGPVNPARSFFVDDKMVSAPVDENGEQKVISIGLGAMHGIILTDSGTPWTWGDSRYGQLGRRCMAKEEHENPYPVRELEQEEVIKVASGKHHCMALTATGDVFTWGRNKNGQLGAGTKSGADTRDKTLPVKITPFEEQTTKVVSIGCGPSSCVAACENGDVFQWGFVNEAYDKAKSTSHPYLVMRHDFYTKSMRRDHPVSISSTGRKVKQAEVNEDLLKEQFASIEAIRNVIGDYRKELSSNVGRGGGEQVEKAISKSAAGGGGDVNDLMDTTGGLENEIAKVNREIELYKKNVMSCEAQLRHVRTQLQVLEHQGVQLGDSADKVAVDLVGNPAGPELRRLQERLSDIKQFMEANQNTRMTLLDQRAEVEKDKARLNQQKMLAEQNCKLLSQRLKIVNDLGADSATSTGASNMAVNHISKKLRDLKKYKEGRVNIEYADFGTVKREAEEGQRFLADLVASLKEMAVLESHSGRVMQLEEMMMDVINLQRNLNDFQLDKWCTADLDMAPFFEGSRKPKEPEEEGLLTSS